MKVVFLDVDGVLNRIKGCPEKGDILWSNETGKEHLHIEPKLCEIFRKFVKDAESLTREKVQIVISSSWRNLVSEGEEQVLFDFLSAAIILPADRFVGVTARGDFAHRSKQIEAWARDRGVVPADILIFDDNIRIFATDSQVVSRLVVTNSKLDLSVEDVKRGLALLHIFETLEKDYCDDEDKHAKAFA